MSTPGTLSIRLGLKEGCDLRLSELATVTVSLHKLLRALEKDVTGKPARIQWAVTGVEFIRGSGIRLTVWAPSGESVAKLAEQAQKGEAVA